LPQCNPSHSTCHDASGGGQGTYGVLSTDTAEPVEVYHGKTWPSRGGGAIVGGGGVTVPPGRIRSLMVEKPSEQPRIRDVVLPLSPHTHSYGTQPNPWLLTLIQPSSGVDYTFATLPRLARRVSGSNRGAVIMSQRVGKGRGSFLFIDTRFI
jgi:hypothetical protein